jgi:hypothetical protein
VSNPAESVIAQREEWSKNLCFEKDEPQSHKDRNEQNSSHFVPWCLSGRVFQPGLYWCAVHEVLPNGTLASYHQRASLVIRLRCSMHGCGGRCSDTINIPHLPANSYSNLLLCRCVPSAANSIRILTLRLREPIFGVMSGLSSLSENDKIVTLSGNEVFDMVQILHSARTRRDSE